MSEEVVPIPRLKKDWAGRYVRLKRQVSGGYSSAIFEIGEIFKVGHNYKGLHLETVHSCDKCNRGYRMSVIAPEAWVELLPADYKPEWSARLIIDPARYQALINVVTRKMDIEDHALIAQMVKELGHA